MSENEGKKNYNKGKKTKKEIDDMETELLKRGSNNKTNKLSKIPFLTGDKGKVVIDANDPKQVKWFEEFKK